MRATLVSLISLSALCLAQTTIGPSEVAAAITSKDTLESLEAMGISVLSEILSSSIEIIIQTQPASTSATTSASSTFQTSASTTASPTSSPALTSANSKTTASTTPNAAVDPAKKATNHTDRDLAIILGTLLGVILLALLIAGLLFCCRRHRRNVWGKRTVSPVEDDEISTWRRPMSQRNTLEDAAITQPQPPYQQGVERPISGAYAPVPQPEHHYQQEANGNPFDDEPYGYNNRHSGAPLTEGPAVFTNESSSSDEHDRMHDRSPTPFFGTSRNGNAELAGDNSYNGGAGAMGAAPYNGAVISRRPVPADATLHTDNRQSAAAEPMYSDATAYNGNGPWVPPSRSPRRPRSLPRSPLANDDGNFHFGFQDQPMRHSLNGHYPVDSPSRGNGVTSPIGEAHQRF